MANTIISIGGLLLVVSAPMKGEISREREMADWDLANTGAAKLAAKHAGDTYSDLKRSTKKTIKKAISQLFLEGLTIGDVVDQLRKHMDEERAVLIASTEITRASAQAEQAQGEADQKEFESIKVTKVWMTNNDDLVCPICSALNDKVVGINECFTENIFLPPAHEGCRCWISHGMEFV